MWLLNYVTKNSISDPKPEKGNIRNSSDGYVQVNASSDYHKIPMVAPYGVACVPPDGEKSVVMTANGEEVCMGVVSAKQELNPGEVMLFSSGGASIVLKNDGSVYINGKKYS